MNATLSTVELLDHVVQRGLADRRVAERAVHATLSVLGQRLMDDEAAMLSAGLPAELARVVDQSEYDSDFDAAELYERVRGRENATSLGDAREHAEVVLAVIGETLDDAVRRLIARALPEDVGRTMLPRTTADVPPHAVVRRTSARTTLVTGRPGSRHSLAESAPPDHNQSQSVASSNPHNDTKLSSNQGLTQERLDESLAAGRP